MTFKTLIPAFAAALLFTACGMDASEAELGMDESAELSSSELAVVLGTGRFETFTGRDGQYYFNLRAGNGQRVLVSEGYASSSGRAGGIASVKNNGVTESRYLLREASDGSWYFVLTATNGQIIGLSEMYSTKSNAVAGMGRVQQLIKNTVAQEVAQRTADMFETFRGLDGKYYFHLRAGNGEIILQSQGYTSSSGAKSGIASVQANGVNQAMFSVLPAADGRYYFNLKAANGRIIGRSEIYETKYNAERGVTAVVRILTGGAR